MTTTTINVPVEVREAEDGPRLHGTIIAEGRAASGGRRELFAPGAVTWPEPGIAIRLAHHGRAEVHARPVRQPNGEIRIAVKATPAIAAAVASGKDAMSVEFFALREHRTAGGGREILRALVDGAALTDDPEYHQTRAEVRRRRRAQVWL